jgi:hypothetical protein
VNDKELLNLSALPQVSIYNKKLLPNIPAVYVVLDHNESVLYVGKAKNLKTRWSAHHRFDLCVKNNAQRIAWLECEESEMAKLEQTVMLSARPLLNGVPTLARKADTKDCFRFNTGEDSKWHLSGVSASEALALTALVLKAKLGGMVYASQAELAAVVKCNRATLNKGLQSLITKDLVFSIPGKRAQYQINPQIGTKLA